MHISTMSSSDTEVALNGVPSCLVKTKRHIPFLRLYSLDGAQSLPEAMAEDMVDIIEKDNKDIGKFFFCDAIGSSRLLQRTLSIRITIYLGNS